jgi:septal ring-binding cell division protein DamX
METDMRKFILITATVLVSATAQAGTVRGLALASNDEPAATEPSKAVEAPKYVERPSGVDTTSQQPAEQPKPEPCKPANSATASKTDKWKHRHESTEARVIYW